MLFRGHSVRSLDAKGRLMLPTDFRDALAARSSTGSCTVITYEQCLVVYPQPEWDEFFKQISNLKNATRRMRDFRRVLLGCSEEYTPDPQGRIRLSKEHMLYAGLERNVAVVGQGNIFEIWDNEAFVALQQQDFGDVAAELAGHGIELPL